MGNPEIFLRRLKIDKVTGMIEISENNLTFENLKPVKPLRITYASNFKSQ